MSLTPRVLLSIDYEPWFALFKRYNRLIDPSERRELDAGFTLHALDPILEKLGDARVSFFLVGEIAGWYPEVPEKIVSSGHELGLHCQFHRSLVNVDELAQDIQASSFWREKYNVRGYRAPMVGISEGAYALLEKQGFQYSSSIYAPAGRIFQRDRVWEIPVSTLELFGGSPDYTAPRDFSIRLLLKGEFPYGSSFSIGLLGREILRILERELARGFSPVIILHPYELVKPSSMIRMVREVTYNPWLLPFLKDKSGFLIELLRNFPVSPIGSYLDEALKDMETR